MPDKSSRSKNTVGDFEGCDSGVLFQVLHDADEGDLEKILQNPSLTSEHIVLILLENKFLTPNIIKKIRGNPQWSSKYNIQVAMVNCPITPKVIALTFVRFLYWKDLLKVSKNLRLTPPVRLMADVTLRDRLPEITVGERVSLARMASRALIRTLVHDRAALVFRALLDNPQLTEEDLINLATNRNASPQSLSILAAHKKWSYRYGIKMALLRNRRTPTAAAISLLSGLLEHDLKGLLEGQRLPKIIKLCAVRLLKEKKSKRKNILH